MTTKNALKIIDHVIQKKSQLKSDFLNLEMPWNQGEGKIPEFSQQLAQVMARDVEILTQIKNELQPNCKHPKRLRDKTRDGTLYCMGCNLGL